MKVRSVLLALAAFGGATVIPVLAAELAADVAGEVGTSSVLLQARITPEMRQAAQIPANIEGWARFEAADNPDFSRPVVGAWIKIQPENDSIIKYMFGRANYEYLRGNRTYYWRYQYGPSPAQVRPGPVHTFQTTCGVLSNRAMKIAVVQGLDLSTSAGLSALDKVAAAKPDYVVFNGNSVAYDATEPKATTAEAMRAKWHDLLSQPKLVSLLGGVGSYWLKNDRDFRFVGADATAGSAPDAELGAMIFREQVPVTDPRDPASLTFRAVQASRDLAMWMLEGRDYRSANSTADSKDKSLWGPSQADWLQRSILNSNSPFRLVIQPTAIVGPDSSPDSHATAFRTERQAFLDHVKANKLDTKGLIVLVGGNSQYDSVAAEGLEEVSIGSLGARLSSAPAAAPGVEVRYSQRTPAPGFALVEVVPGTPATAATADKPATEGIPAKLTISLINAETGAVVHTLTRTAVVAAPASKK